MDRELSFNPFFLFKSAFRQTIMGYMLGKGKDIPSERKILSLNDGDKIVLEISEPKNWKKENITVVLVHGLCGSYKSPLIIRTARNLLDRGLKVVRVNLRGCGSGKGLAKNTYHSGNVEDIYEVLKFLKRKNKFSNIVLVGFSLGGNMILRMAGDIKDLAVEYLDKIIALSPPVDLKASVELFEKKENKVYLKYFSKQLKEDVQFLTNHFDGFPDFSFPENMTISDFNKLFIVPVFGYEDEEDYYRKSSSIHVVSDIRVSCNILFSEDDPLICSKKIRALNLPENVNLYFTKKGGHLGYLGSFKDKRGFFWLDSVLLDWILN